MAMVDRLSKAVALVVQVVLRYCARRISMRKTRALRLSRTFNLGVQYPNLPSTFQGGPSSPTWRTSEAKEASVLFSPAVDVLYGNVEPTTVSWAAEKRRAVALGEAEPMNGDLRIFGCR
jgi:hypothetical protein